MLNWIVQLQGLSESLGALLVLTEAWTQRRDTEQENITSCPKLVTRNPEKLFSLQENADGHNNP